MPPPHKAPAPLKTIYCTHRKVESIIGMRLLIIITPTRRGKDHCRNILIARVLFSGGSKTKDLVNKRSEVPFIVRVKKKSAQILTTPLSKKKLDNLAQAFSTQNQIAGF